MPFGASRSKIRDEWVHVGRCLSKTNPLTARKVAKRAATGPCSPGSAPQKVVPMCRTLDEYSPGRVPARAATARHRWATGGYVDEPMCKVFNSSSNALDGPWRPHWRCKWKSGTRHFLGGRQLFLLKAQTFPNKCKTFAKYMWKWLERNVWLQRNETFAFFVCFACAIDHNWHTFIL